MFVFHGCTVRELAVKFTLPLVEDQQASLLEEEDPVLAEHAIPAQLKMLEGFLKADGANVRLLDRLAEGFCGYAFSFVEDKDKARASALYLRGRRYARLALEKDMGGVTGLDGNLEETENVLHRATALPSLFWLGQCWGGWVMLNLDDVAALADVSKVEKIMQRVLELDPSYHYAGPHMFLGSFYGGRTRLLGGNPEKARRHFEQSLALTENRFLLNQVMYARTYAVQTQDRQLFETLLKGVLSAPAGILPGQRLANQVAKVKAKKLLESADELF
ncbi:MAG: TRAP transporter TatT component family protein [Nitrospinales bacterium]